MKTGSKVSTPGGSEPAEGVRRVRLLDYDDCIELSNADTRVVLGHHVGGRVLKYEWRGRESLYLNPLEARWRTERGRESPEASAGRFDIGPEHLVPPRDILWSGAWSAEVTGPRAARLTSQVDGVTGVQLVREIRLASAGAHLECTQIIRNISGGRKSWCHWGRTLARHGGIAVVPLTPFLSKFPNGYVMYTRGHDPSIGFRPVDARIRERDGFLEILGAPARPKLGFDSHAGWFAYQMPDDLLFVKAFATYPDRVYNEVAGLTLSIWYPCAEEVPGVELEPIGPREDIAPGACASFTEHWWLLENRFPGSDERLDLVALSDKVEGLMKARLNKE